MIVCDRVKEHPGAQETSWGAKCVRWFRRLDGPPARTLAALFSRLRPRRSGDANDLCANDRAHLRGNANDLGGNDRTLNPGRNLARNRNRDGDGGGKKETENPGLGVSLTT